jgi:hypothetical protein
MTTHRFDESLSRRAAIAGFGVTGIGLALATASGQAGAQEASPSSMVTHPLVGTWIVNRDPTSEIDAPSIVVFTSDGGVLDPSLNVAGVWRATGPRSAEWTLVVLIQMGAGGYAAVRTAGELDEGDNTMDPFGSVTIVSPDGTVIATSRGHSHYNRLQVETIEDESKPLAGFPTWMPEATPTS